VHPVNTGTLRGYGGWPVFYRWGRPEKPRASVLLVHGYGEHSGRYGRVIQALVQGGLTVLAPDHRGHGLTARLLGDMESREHVLADLGIAHRRLLELGPSPVFLVGHSLGAALSLRYQQRHPGAIAGMVLNGVALRVPDSVPSSVQLLARLIARLYPTLPLQPFFDATRNTRDPTAQRILREDPLGYRGPIRVRTGVEVMALIQEVRQDLPRVEVPALLTHGEIDKHVPVSVSREVAAAMRGGDITVRTFPGLLHETYQEPERDEVIASWVEWITSRLRYPEP
jgi:acylglycerol lipase